MRHGGSIGSLKHHHENPRGASFPPSGVIPTRSYKNVLSKKTWYPKSSEIMECYIYKPTIYTIRKVSFFNSTSFCWILALNHIMPGPHHQLDILVDKIQKKTFIHLSYIKFQIILAMIYKFASMYISPHFKTALSAGNVYTAT